MAGEEGTSSHTAAPAVSVKASFHLVFVSTLFLLRLGEFLSLQG